MCIGPVYLGPGWLLALSLWRNRWGLLPYEAAQAFIPGSSQMSQCGNTGLLTAASQREQQRHQGKWVVGRGGLLLTFPYTWQGNCHAVLLPSILINEGQIAKLCHLSSVQELLQQKPPSSRSCPCHQLCLNWHVDPSHRPFLQSMHTHAHTQRHQRPAQSPQPYS